MRVDGIGHFLVVLHTKSHVVINKTDNNTRMMG